MKGKKGWILIVESVIAILILFGFLFITISKQVQQIKIVDEGEYFYNIVSELALKAIKTNEIRNSTDCSFIKNKLEEIYNEISLSVSIEGLCDTGNLPEGKEIYSSEVIIFDSENTKKLKIFIWK